jgi:CrcB protein
MPAMATPWHYYLLVALGSALGGMSRFYAANLIGRAAGPAFPWGTFAVNVLGCLCVGALAACFEPGSPLHLRTDLRALAIVGFLGGFTTFSAFSLEAVQLLQRGQPGVAIVYVLASLVSCLLAAWLAYTAFSAALR